jgi:hypothetical protein
LAANEGARSFIHESTRDLSIEQIREMYRQAIRQLINELAETEEFFRAGIVAIDITEDDPFTGDRTDHEDEIIGTKEKNDEYAYHWATVQLVGSAVPLVLDACPVRKGESRKEIVEDLLDSAEGLVHVDNVLMDRGFDGSTFWRYSASVGSPTSSRSGCRRARKPKPSDCSSGTKTGMKPIGNSTSARTNGTRRRWSTVGRRIPTTMIIDNIRCS